MPKFTDSLGNPIRYHHKYYLPDINGEVKVLGIYPDKGLPIYIKVLTGALHGVILWCDSTLLEVI